MPGLQHQFVFSDQLEDLREFRHRLAVSHDRDAWSRLFEEAYVIFGIESRQPHHATFITRKRHHPRDRLGVESADRSIEHHAAETLHPGGTFRDNRSIGCHREVVLEDQSSHPLGLCNASDVEVRDGSRKAVGPRMHMKVDHPVQRILFHVRWSLCLGRAGRDEKGQRRQQLDGG